MNNKLIRKNRVKGKITQKDGALRLSVHATLTHIYAQIINDKDGKTLCEASDLKLKEKLTKTERAKKIGSDIAEKAIKAGIKKVVFDRGSKLYHGRIKAVAEAAREKGLEF
jgi:large subunit ribosomal protein L18